MLATFLKNSKQILDDIISNKVILDNVKLVFGNESADLDSIFSSLIYSYYQSSLKQKSKEIYIPIINIREQEILSRFEFLYLFKLMNLDATALIYLNTFDVELFFQSHKDAEVVLVDHNMPSQNLKFLITRVTEIIDHHEEKQGIYKEGQLKKKKIEKIGSCISLIYEETQSNCDSIENFHDEIDLFVLATLLIDTYHFNPKEKGLRWVEKDEKVLKSLLHSISKSKSYPLQRQDNGEPDTQALYENVSNIKFDKDMNLDLSVENLLIKDFKKFTYSKATVGYSVILVSAKVFFQEKITVKEFLPLADRFKAEESIDILILLFVSKVVGSGEVRREQVLFGSELNDLTNYLLKDKNLILVEDEIAKDSKLRLIKDTSQTYTRKRLEPIVESFFKQLYHQFLV